MRDKNKNVNNTIFIFFHCEVNLFYQYRVNEIKH